MRLVASLSVFDSVWLWAAFSFLFRYSSMGYVVSGFVARLGA
jgi:hypothetical protein